MKLILATVSWVVASVLCFPAFGQNAVSGIVKDAETGEALPGVSVVLKGTTKGKSTDIEGRYQLDLTDQEMREGTIQSSYLGYKKQSIPIEGRTEINIELESNQELLNEVVVTAIGIEKDKRKMGYSVSEVDGEQILESREANVVNALNAKVAGVSVTSTSGSPGASSTIRIRGNQSINGANDPLFIVDGIPIDNNYRGSNFTDQANRALDINPDDIESISVLKGGAASALYGLQASNGAVVINTKQGKNGKTEVTFSSTTTIDQVNKLPEKQSRYSQGAGGEYVEGVNTTWGAPLSSLRYAADGSIVPSDDPEATGNRIEPFDNLNNFFRTGVTLNNNISVRGGNENSGFYLSASDLRQSGIVPLTDYNRTSIRATGNTAIRENMDIKFSANYVSSNADRAQRGSNLSGVMLGLMRSPPSYDLTNGTDDPVNTPSAYSNPNGSQRTYHDTYDNPYWSINKNRNEESLNRLIGFVEFKWRPYSWLTITERPGVDTYAEKRKSHWDAGSNEFKDLGGAIFDETVTQKNIVNDFIVNAEYSFSEDFNASLTVGHNYQEFNKTFYIVDGFDFVIDGFYDMSNVASLNVEADDFLDRSRLMGVYGDLSLDYKRMHYLTFTGRNDWSSTLPNGNNSFFYPSVSYGFVFTELADFGFVEYGKLRSSFAVTGNDAFQNYLTTNYFVSGGSTQGQLSYFPNSTIGNNQLSPEFTRAFEVGTDLRSRNNRVRLDLSYYNTSSRDQIVVVPIANSTGYTNFVTNIGQIDNRGWEALVEADILERNVSKPNSIWWKSSLNFTRNRSEVVSLAQGQNNIALPSNGLASTQSRVIVGYQYGVLYGSRWLRDDAGNILVDDNGYPIRDSENGVIGDPNPDFTMGWRNGFGWRNFSLSFLLDIRVGGDMYNGTKAVSRRLGTHIDTENRQEEIIWDGVYANGGEVNVTPIRIDEEFFTVTGGGLVGVSEYNIEEVNWVRLRDLNLTYSFSPELCKRIGISRASVTVTARNLFLITNYTGIDPETSLGGASNAFGRDYFNNPNTRSYGLNLSVTF
ncbi:MAG: SusC/RagA family TonB-linked outer membrane protein [Cryomorphaceae bacterium]|nr:SusC/RagA family TonB-linked outer membrane protein [Flavobacteriales bacterium]